MYLIFCLGRLDVFPVSDLAVKKAMAKWYSNNVQYLSVKKMLTISECWKPYRSIATWYLWKSLSKSDEFW